MFDVLCLTIRESVSVNLANVTVSTSFKDFNIEVPFLVTHNHSESETDLRNHHHIIADNDPSSRADERAGYVIKDQSLG